MTQETDQQLTATSFELSDNSHGARLLAASQELRKYREENQRLSRELHLVRRAFGAYVGAPDHVSPLHPFPVPPEVVPTQDILFHLDVCEIRSSCVVIEGWAFLPDLNALECELTIWLSSNRKRWLVRPQRVDRPDVAAHFAKQRGLTTGRLDLAGFRCAILRSSLPKGDSLAVELQIDSLERSGRKITGKRIDV